MKDQVLWKQIQNNDNQALKEVFDLYYKVLCSYIVQFTHDMPEAEDIVQNTFIKLWEKRNKITINTSLKSYLFRVSYNECMDNIKRKKRKDLLLENLKYKLLQSQLEQDQYIVNQKIKRIKTLVDTLPKRCKEILLLSKEKGLKNKEIAIKLNISIKTVESQIRIAFQKIRNGI
ncbi:RNA polymerase sigma-70 factor [Flavobacteriaceae bacterium AU392]|nr:RNA polymerase sigma-70 factor [Flavobacteriaceae bacterium]RKM84766.1 RNA polymerase sigma-70 factor [Flavobacteriaceae bacterium AU392]